MYCCGLRPQPRHRAAAPPPRAPLSSRRCLSDCLQKLSRLPSAASPPPLSAPRRRLLFHLRLSYFLRKPPPSSSPPAAPPPAPLLNSFLRSPLPLLQNFDGVDLRSLLPPPPSSSASSLPIDQLPCSEPCLLPNLESEQKLAGSAFPSVDGKLNAAVGDLSCDARVASARMERNCGWPYLLDRTMDNTVTRAAFLGVTTGVVLVGKVALVGVSMTVAMACSSLQMVRRTWDSSSGKVTPLPPPHPLPLVASTDLMRSHSDSVVETTLTSSPCSATTHNQAAKSLSPRCIEQLGDRHEDRLPTPCHSAHPLDLVGAVEGSSTLDSPTSPFQSPASRMRNAVAKKHLRESARVLRYQMTEINDVNLSRAELQKSSSLGFCLAAIGLLTCLIGLFAGRILAVLIMVCWFYAVPCLRYIAGGKLAAVSVDSEEAGKVDQKRKKRDLPPVTLTPERWRPSDYRKRVIMEGILDRDRRPATVQGNSQLASC